MSSKLSKCLQNFLHSGKSEVRKFAKQKQIIIYNLNATIGGIFDVR